MNFLEFGNAYCLSSHSYEGHTDLCLFLLFWGDQLPEIRILHLTSVPKLGKMLRLDRGRARKQRVFPLLAAFLDMEVAEAFRPLLRSYPSFEEYWTYVKINHM